MVTLRSQRSTGKATLPETPDLALAGFQFYKFMYYGISMEELVLPDKFASALRGRELWEVKLRMACCEGQSAWDVEVIADEYGDMCLGAGWREFAGANGLEPGQLLVFHFDGAALLTVKVFDDSDCRRSCQHEEDGSAEGKSSLPPPGSDSEGDGSSEDEEWNGAEEPVNTEPAPAPAPSLGPSLFSVMLSKCHFGLKNGQYLNVPPEFDRAHGYAARSKVELQMRGESWTVNLKHSKRDGRKTRTAFRYGWRQFCVDNALGLGDTCFFHAHGGAGHVLRVEVRKPDGTTLR